MSAANTEQQVRIRVPAIFYDDHVSRDLRAGVEVKRNSQSVTIDVTPADFDELRSDAEHYASPGQFESDYAQIVGSARSTVKALARQSELVDELRVSDDEDAELAQWGDADEEDDGDVMNDPMPEDDGGDYFMQARYVRNMLGVDCIAMSAEHDDFPKSANLGGELCWKVSAVRKWRRQRDDALRAVYEQERDAR